MGKRRSWFSALKKAISPASKQIRNKNNWKRAGCFRRQKSIAGLAENPLTEEVTLVEAEGQQNRHAYSVALVTAMAAEAAVAAANAAAEVVRLRALVAAKTTEEMASIKIQAAFRGYMARRMLRALRGLVRLKSVVGGKSVMRQAASSLKCMQTVAHLQSEIRTRRLANFQQLILQKQDNKLKGEIWDESTRSKEQIEAEISNRQEGAMRRERALAYDYSHKSYKNTSESTKQTFVDPNNQGWSWSERWMAARPWEKVKAAGDLTNNSLVAGKTASGCVVQSPASQGGERPPSRRSPSTPKSRGGGKMRPASPMGGLGTDDDWRSLNSTQSEQCRRWSIAGSSVRDDDSLASEPAVPGYMAYTESARAKSRLASPHGSDTSSSVRKQLSFSGSPARSRRHQGRGYS